MFQGITNLSVDAKGRVAIPKAHRDRLAESGIDRVVVTADPALCLLVYPLPDWEDIRTRLNSLPNTMNQLARSMQRLYIGHAMEVDFDSTGRILLSAELRAFAGIDRKVVLIGQGKKFELWNDVAWEAEVRKAAQHCRDFRTSEQSEGMDTLVI